MAGAGMPDLVQDPIALSFHYSAREVARAMRCHYASILHPLRDIAVATVVLVAGIYLWRSTDAHSFGLFLIVASTALLIILFAAFVIIPVLSFHTQPKLRDNYYLEFAQGGIHFRTAHIDSNLEWTLYTRVLVDRDFYLLYYGSRSFTIVPRRVFADSQQQGAFEQLVRQKVAKVISR